MPDLDLRVYPRLSVSIEAEIRIDASSAWQSATILNLSAGGALLFTEEEVPTLTVFSPLRFPLGAAEGESATIIEVEALAVRTLPDEAGRGEGPGFLSGLQFLDLRGEQFEKVHRFVLESQAE